jgi:hypothetical protein
MGRRYHASVADTKTRSASGCAKAPGKEYCAVPDPPILEFLYRVFRLGSLGRAAAMLAVAAPSPAPTRHDPAA